MTSPSIDITDMTVASAADLLASGETTSAELTDAALAHIEANEPRLGAYITVAAKEARAAAATADALLKDGKGSRLTGVPVGIKDVLCTRGLQTTAASQLLKGFVPPYTATAVARLEAQGMVMVGKTNCDEFAMGSSTENSSYGDTSNPWNTDYVPGGSSGGSAATVAAGSVPVSLGTDTGGSIRQPASLCGVVGFKPTYGRVSRYGLIAFASSLDQIGPFSRTVEDAALIYDAIAGYDPNDSTSVTVGVESATAGLGRGIAGMKFGVPKEYFGSALDKDVRAAVEEAMRVIEGLGGKLVEVSLPSTEMALSVYYVIAPAECSSNLARFDGVRFGVRGGGDTAGLVDMYRTTREEGFGPEVKRRIMLGTYVLSHGYYDAYYRQAQRVRTLVAREFDQVFADVDCLVAPTTPGVAFKKGAISDPLTMYANDVLTVPVNLAGLPGVSLPCGLSDGLPIGLQLIGPRYGDALVLQAAAAYEGATTWHKAKPPVEVAS